MSTVTENDLKELKELIISNQANLEKRLTNIEKGQIEMKERLAVIETRLEDWKPSIEKTADLSEKVGELKNWRQIGLVVLTAGISSIFSGTIGGVIGWLIKSGRP